MMQKGRAILYLGYPLLEYQRQKKGGLTAHAAAFSIGKRGILVLGKVGAGKSSTTIEVCRKKEAALIANDLCLLSNSSNEFSITGGTKFLFLRLESVRRNMLGLETFFDTRESLDSWLNKEIIQPQEIDIQIEKEVVPLSAAFLVHIDERQNSLFVKKAHDLATILYLNENFSRYIRSTCTTMLGGPNHQILGYIPSLDNEHFFKKRKDLIEYLINNLGLVYVSGKLSDVVLYIESQLQM